MRTIAAGEAACVRVQFKAKQWRWRRAAGANNVVWRADAAALCVRQGGGYSACCVPYWHVHLARGLGDGAALRLRRNGRADGVTDSGADEEANATADNGTDAANARAFARANAAAKHRSDRGTDTCADIATHTTPNERTDGGADGGADAGADAAADAAADATVPWARADGAGSGGCSMRQRMRC